MALPELSVAAAARAPSNPGTAALQAAQRPTYVARRRRKSAKSPRPPAVEPVKVRTKDSRQATLKLSPRKSVKVFVVEPAIPLRLEVSGPGKLTLTLHQLLAPKGRGKNAAAQITVDGKAGRPVTLPAAVAKKLKLVGDTAAVARPKAESLSIDAGAHAIEITVPETSKGAALVIEFRPKGAKKPAPIVVEELAPSSDLMAAALSALDDEDELPLVAEPGAPPTSDLMAAALSLDDDDEESPPAPPAPPAPAAPAAPPPPAPQPKPAPKPEPAPAPKESPADKVKRLLAAGEIRDGLLDSYEPLTLVPEGGGERHTFHKVGGEQSYSFIVAGPGVVTVRLHRLIGPGRVESPNEEPYAVVILEDDVLLQRLGGATKASTQWKVEGGGPTLSEPKEYQLKIGGKRSRLAIQIAQAPEGMAIRYTFDAEEISLTAMALSMDDEDEAEGGISLAAAALPTVVMEVDRTERAVAGPHESFLGLAAEVGAVVPQVGREPGLMAALEVSAVLPFLGRMVSLGAQGGYQSRTLSIQVGDPDGAAVDASWSIVVVPVLGNLSLRIPAGAVMGLDVALCVHAGAGMAYVRARRRALGADDLAARWSMAARGGVGTEMELGPGWLALGAGYLFVPPADLGNILGNYTPGGMTVGMQYRLGI